MKKILSTIILCSCCLLTTSFFSCNSTKNLQKLIYLNDSIVTNLKDTINTVTPLVQPNDRLSILVSAFNPASAAPYNIGGGVQTSGQSVVAGSVAAIGYLVKPNGTIQFPQLGVLYVKDKSLQQVANEVTGMLQKFVTDPMVSVNFLNYKITVLGEVGRPGPIPVPDGNLNIIEAVGIAGDLTIFGRRDNILVVREVNGKREFGRVNLLSKSIFNSPYYHLQQNDIVYVQMDKNKANSSDQSVNRTIGLAATVVSVLSTLVFIIINVIR